MLGLMRSTTLQRLIIIKFMFSVFAGFFFYFCCWFYYCCCLCCRRFFVAFGPVMSIMFAL